MGTPHSNGTPPVADPAPGEADRSRFPLEGLRVVDLSRVLSGPFAGRMLSDLGADVVKIEPPEGDVARLWGEVRHGLSGFYTQQNCGKRNVCIDLKVDGGPELARELVAYSDVVVENFRPGVASRLGLGWETLRSRNPKVIMLSISGFGQAGPDADRPAFAPVIHAESGLVYRQAESDGARPFDPMLSIADFNAGLHGVVAILAAVLLRQTTGRGEYIDLSMLHTALLTDDYAHHYLDGSPVGRLGGIIWETAGRPILVSADLRHTWRQLSSIHGLSDQLPGSASLEDKIAQRRILIASWFRSFPDRPGLHGALDKADLVHAEIRSPEEAFSSALAASPSIVTRIDDRGGGHRHVVDSPYQFADAAAGVRGPAPYRGEHNAEVLREWLGAGCDRVRDLTDRGVLQSEAFADGGQSERNHGLRP